MAQIEADRALTTENAYAAGLRDDEFHSADEDFLSANEEDLDCSGQDGDAASGTVSDNVEDSLALQASITIGLVVVTLHAASTAPFLQVMSLSALKPSKMLRINILLPLYIYIHIYIYVYIYIYIYISIDESLFVCSTFNFKLTPSQIRCAGLALADLRKGTGFLSVQLAVESFGLHCLDRSSAILGDTQEHLLVESTPFDGVRLALSVRLHMPFILCPISMCLPGAPFTVTQVFVRYPSSVSRHELSELIQG